MSDNARCLPSGGRPLALRVRILARLLRNFYFGRIDIVGARTLPDASRPLVSSHRNGAIDGYNVLHGFARAQALVSIQLVQHRLLR